MGSPDTGAREPLDSVSALLQRAQEMRGRAEVVIRMARSRNPAGASTAHLLAHDVVALTGQLAALASAAKRVADEREGHELGGESPLYVALLALDETLALAAGVGVPPPENQDLVSAPARERQDARLWVDVELRPNGQWYATVWIGRAAMAGSGLRDTAQGAFDAVYLDHYLARLAASEASAAEGRKPKTPAGVGEARPAARGTTREDMLKDTMRPKAASVGAPAEEQPDARALLDMLRTMEERDLLALNREGQRSAIAILDGLLAESAGLREQLDAARQTFEWLEMALGSWAVFRDDSRVWASNEMRDIEGRVRAARAALGDVAAGANQEVSSGSALDQRAVETRGEAATDGAA